MATITTTFDTEHDLTVQTVFGAVSSDELTSTLKAYYASRVTRLILWDFTDADMESITGAQVQQIVGLTVRFAALRPGGKTAMVVSSDLGYGLGRMFEALRQEDPAESSHAVFRSKDLALKWLVR